MLVAANLIAVLVQYLSSKLGLVSGQSLPGLLGDRLRKSNRLAYWGQAEVVAIATDLAEVIGGAIALKILFDIPLLLGGVIVGVVSLFLLSIQSTRGQRPFEFVIIGFLVIIAIGFLAGLFVGDVNWGQAAGGIVPRLEGTNSVVLAASMLGAPSCPMRSICIRLSRSTVIAAIRPPRPGSCCAPAVGTSCSPSSSRAL